MSDECIICLKKLPPKNRRILPLVCGHGCFHHDCIQAWFDVTPSCPMCKHPAPTSHKAQRESRAQRRRSMAVGLGCVSMEEEELMIAAELSLYEK